jgi:non-ribosomal peptide synthetase component F
LLAQRLHQHSTVSTAAIHRIIEQHAAIRVNTVAIVDGDRALTYRELNYAANGLARRLMTHGFRRGCHADVQMPTGIDLAVVLLAVLKMGGSYTWRDPGPYAAAANGISFSTGASTSDVEYLHLDVSSALAEPVTCSPNLPIVTRASDVACILDAPDGAPPVMVPHETIAALRARTIPQRTPFVGESGAFDLWMALLAGGTAVVVSHAAAVAA